MSRRRTRGADPATEARVAELHAKVKAEAKGRPATYRFIAESGEVIYVGKAKALRTRLLSYFRAEYPGEKGARILRDAAHIEWDYEPSEFAACLAELRTIKRLRPRHNVMMKRDARNHCFIKLTRGPAPRLMVVRGAGSADGGVYYGPFIGANRIREAIRELNDALGLRDCTLDSKMRFADQREIWPPLPRTPGCIRHEIGRCLGPCVAAPTEAAYAERLEVARAFLDGTDDAPLVTLHRAMLDASDALEFERAASLRDKLQRLETLRAQFDRLRFAVESLTFAYHVPGHGGDDRVYLVRRGRVRHELASPATAALESAAAQVFSAPGFDRGAVPSHEVDELMLLTWWFTKFPDELARTSPPDRLVPAAVA